MSYTHTYKTIVQTFDEVQQYLAINAELEISQFYPDLEWAENRYLKPILGEELLEYLRVQLDSSNMSAEAIALLPYCQKIEVYLAMCKFIPMLQVQVSAAGVRINTDGGNKTAFQWQIEDLKQEYLAEKGFQFIEDLYKFLEDNQEDYEALGWEGDLTTNNRQFFIRSATDFNQHVRINESRRVYVNIMPIMKAVEDFRIEGQLGTDFYQELKDAIRADTLGGEDSNADGPEIDLVNKYIAPAVAYLTMSEALLDLNLVITADGIIMSNIIATGLSDSVKQKGIPRDNLLETKRNEYERKGLAYLRRMKEYLDANASEDVFATYFESDLYSDPDGTDPVNPDRNTEDKIFNGL